MTRRMFGAVALAAGVLGGFSAQAQTTDEAAALRLAEARGRAIHAFDQAAWVSTDELLRLIPDPHKAGVGGFVVEPLADGTLRAIYYRQDGETPKAVFTADVQGREILARRVFEAGEEAALSPTAARLVAARDVAWAEIKRRGYGPCAKAAFNTVALPAETPDGPTRVYFLTPQTEANAYPFGGHYAVDVAADGRIVAARAFTKSCLTLPVGEKTAGLQVSHLLDPTPTEIHVFSQRAMERAVYVGTADQRIWKVEADGVSLLQDKAGAGT